MTSNSQFVKHPIPASPRHKVLLHKRSVVELLFPDHRVITDATSKLFLPALITLQNTLSGAGRGRNGKHSDSAALPPRNQRLTYSIITFGLYSQIELHLIREDGNDWSELLMETGPMEYFFSLSAQSCN